MSISFKNFEKWAKKKFGDQNVKIQGKEIRIHSIFETGDDDFHLWCSPSGGKKKRKNGTYHCFKTDKKGSLVKLVMIVEGCDRDEAVAKLHGHTSIREVERQLVAFFAEQDQQQQVETPKSNIKLPEHCYLISDLGTNNWWRKKAEEYLNKRKIPI